MENSNSLQPAQNKKKWFGILSLIVLVLGIPLAVWLAQRAQIFIPKAEIKPIELVAGVDSCVVSNDPNKVKCATFPIKLTSPLGSPVSEKECRSDNDCPVGDKCFSYQNYPGTCRLVDTVCATVLIQACTTDQVQCDTFPSPCYVPPGWTTSSSTVPVYEVYRKDNGNIHFFTTRASEKDGLIASKDWLAQNPPVAWYAYTTAQANTVPVYEVYRKDNGNIHFFTTRASEKDGLIASKDWLAQNPPVAWYAPMQR